MRVDNPPRHRQVQPPQIQHDVSSDSVSVLATWAKWGKGNKTLHSSLHDHKNLVSDLRV